GHQRLELVPGAGHTGAVGGPDVDRLHLNLHHHRPSCLGADVRSGRGDRRTDPGPHPNPAAAAGPRHHRRHPERLSAMPATMHDVAARAGVSQRTVSNVVNNYVHVKPETRRKVLDAIEQLGYRPNILAQRLRHGRTGLVALAVPEIAAPYFAELADHVQRLADEHGVTLLIDQTGGDRE